MGTLCGMFKVVTKNMFVSLTIFFEAAAMPLASPKSQDFVHNCMTRIEHEFGINQARVLSNALKLKRHLASRGAIAFGICPQYLPPDDGPYVPQQGLYNKVGRKVPELLMEASFQASLPSVAEILSGPTY